MNEIDRKHLEHCVELAETALNRGDYPFGSVLVDSNGNVLAEDSNREVTGNDATLHPEFELARWAAHNMTPAERATATVYTSGEHCPMCSAAHAWVGLGRVVYAMSGKDLAAYRSSLGDGPSPVTAFSVTEIAPRVAVDGPEPSLEARLKALHRRSFETPRP